MSIRCRMQCFCLAKALESQNSYYLAHAITARLWYLPEVIR